VSGLGDQTLAELLEGVAAAQPAPGGGSSAALACALAAALVEMAAGVVAARRGGAEPLTPDAGDRARVLRARAIELAERELGSYEPVLEARRLPRDDPARGERIAAALAAASESPASIAETAAEVSELALHVAGPAGPSVRGDALTGCLLAEAAAAAAASLVEINLPDRPGGALTRAREARDRARSAREAAVLGRT
jgi:formiminotetrahydrofolate cyclodeaminase